MLNFLADLYVRIRVFIDTIKIKRHIRKMGLKVVSFDYEIIKEKLGEIKWK